MLQFIDDDNDETQLQRDSIHWLEQHHSQLLITRNCNKSNNFVCLYVCMYVVVVALGAWLLYQSVCLSFCLSISQSGSHPTHFTENGAGATTGAFCRHHCTLESFGAAFR